MLLCQFKNTNHIDFDGSHNRHTHYTNYNQKNELFFFSDSHLPNNYNFQLKALHEKSFDQSSSESFIFDFHSKNKQEDSS